MNELVSYRKLFHYSKAGKVTGHQEMTSAADGWNEASRQLLLLWGRE